MEPRALARGAAHELAEHGDVIGRSRAKARRIAAAHLREHPDYYARLAACGLNPFAGFDSFADCERTTRRARPDVLDVRAYCGAIKRRAEPNPAPAAWKKEPPSTRYECAPWERSALGTFVPGRRGGTVTACATPSKKKPHDGQWWIGLDVTGNAIPKRIAARRKREHGRTVASDPLGIALAVAEWERDDEALPFPIGLETPHLRGSSVCDPEHPVWRHYAGALESAEERFAIVEADAGPFAAGLARLREMRAHPDYGDWVAAMRRCVAGYKGREQTRRGGAVESGTRAAARARAAAVRAGLDVGSAEYLDTLSPAGRAKALRRLGRVVEARALERHMRELRKRR